MRIALYDTNPTHAERIAELLVTAGHSCHTLRDVKAFALKLRRETFDMVLVDAEPFIDADTAAIDALLGAIDEHVCVVVMMSPKAEASPHMAALVGRAQGRVLSKPIDGADLIACAGSLLQRSVAPAAPVATEIFGEYEFDLVTHCVRMDGTAVTLTQKEFELARLLFRHVNRPLSRAAIQQVIWNHACFIPSRTLDTHVSSLRNKLGLRPDRGYRLLPIYRFGYQLEWFGGGASDGAADGREVGVDEGRGEVGDEVSGVVQGRLD